MSVTNHGLFPHIQSRIRHPCPYVNVIVMAKLLTFSFFRHNSPFFRHKDIYNHGHKTNYSSIIYIMIQLHCLAYSFRASVMNSVRPEIRLRLIRPLLKKSGPAKSLNIDRIRPNFKLILRQHKFCSHLVFSS